ncbi:MAG: hypothetical protein EA361_05005 [Bacteroidetes bacterium]|nr:MAG: hypothetical protein EA361_05005 [Bacteroidota bacterium]
MRNLLNLRPSLLLTAIMLLLPCMLCGQNQDEIDRAADLLEQRPELYLSIPSHQLPDATVPGISYDYREEDRTFLYVSRQGWEYLVRNGIDFTVETAPSMVDFDLNMLSWEEIRTRDLFDTWDFYPTYEAYESMMAQFETDFPHLCQIHVAGTLPSGRRLLFARLTSPATTQVPRVMYTSTMHGDETAGYILTLRLIHHLLHNYGTDESLTDLLNSMEIWICPNENPDGTYTNNNATVHGATRRNANGIDLNRNYPNPVTVPELPHQPETLAMMHLADSLDFVLSANMHGGIELVNFPFDTWKSHVKKHADHNWWENAMHQYVDTVRVYAPPNYMTGMGTGVTHGGDWYVVYGSRQDYMNYYRSCREFTLELSNQKLLDPALLPAHWQYNHRSMLTYLQQSRYGLRLEVTDDFSGLPVAATIHLQNHDHSGSEVHTRPTSGVAFRPVEAGMYDIEITAQGYHTALMKNVAVQDFQQTLVEIPLWPEDMLLGDMNGDGVLNVADVILLVNLIMDPSGENQFTAPADVNGDGSIDVADITALVNAFMESSVGRTVR